MRPRVSISLPSLYPRCAERALRNIRDATAGSWQAVLVSPFPPPLDDERVIWISEPEGTGTGCTAGHAAAFERMTGEFVTPFADDHLYIDGWDELAILQYRERSLKTKARPFVLGLRHVQNRCVGTEFGIYYPYFPLARRSALRDIGWFDPGYRQGFADSDFAMRVWAAGGRCEWSQPSMILVTPDDNRKHGAVYAREDMDLFVSRYAERYGAGWNVGDLRGFNLDIDPDRLPPAMREPHTINYNSPDFRRAYGP